LHKTYEEQPIKTKKERNNTRNQETTCMKEKNKNNIGKKVENIFEMQKLIMKLARTKKI